MKYGDILKTGTKVMLKHETDKDFEEFCVVDNSVFEGTYRFARLVDVGSKYIIEVINTIVNNEFKVENNDGILITYSASFGGSNRIYRGYSSTDDETRDAINKLFDKYEKVLAGYGMSAQTEHENESD